MLNISIKEMITEEQLYEFTRLVVAQQLTTDRNGEGQYELRADYGIYNYAIDEDGDIEMKEIKK